MDFLKSKLSNFICAIDFSVFTFYSIFKLYVHLRFCDLVVRFFEYQKNFILLDIFIIKVGKNYSVYCESIFAKVF